MALQLKTFPESHSSSSIHNGADVVRYSKVAGKWSEAQEYDPQSRAYRAIIDGAPNARELADAAGLKEGVHYIDTERVNGHPQATEARGAIEVVAQTGTEVQTQ